MTQATRCVAAHPVSRVVFSPDGKSVAITSSGLSGGALQLFDIDSGTARWKHSNRMFVFEAVSFSADGILLSVGRGARATILDAGDGHVVFRRRVGQLGVQALISPDGTWLTTVGGGRKVWVYDARTGDEGPSVRLNAYCRGGRYSPDGTQIAALGTEATWKPGRPRLGIYVWDAASGQLQARLQNVPAKTDQMQFGGCSHVLVTAATNDSVIRAWDVASGTLTGLCDTAPGTKWLTLGDGCGRVALTRNADRTLRVWDMATGHERTRLPTPQGFWSGAVNGDATKLATSNGGKSVEIWSLAGWPGQQPAPDAAAPDDWCPRCGAG
jgi:WD40 repeat protein